MRTGRKFLDSPNQGYLDGTTVLSNPESIMNSWEKTHFQSILNDKAGNIPNSMPGIGYYSHQSSRN